MGLVVTIGLGALAFLGGSALAHRGYGGSSRAEEALVAWLLALALVMVPVQVLGWLDVLWPWSLALAIALCSVGALAVAGDARVRAREAAGATLRNLTLPFAALREAGRARSATLFALLLLYGVWLWTAWLAWLAPSSSWDGLMYHEGMVAYALRNHGFRWVALPPEIDQLNGFPRGAESLQLFLVAFTDRRLIDFAQHVTAIPTVLAIFVIARRVGSRLLAAGLGASAFAIPGFVLELRSSYVDVTATCMLLAAIHFLTRSTQRKRDLWMLAMTAGLYGGMKGNAPLVCAALLIWQLPRCVPMIRRQRSRAIGTVAGALALAVALAAPVYVRNYLRHDNPAWPVTVEIPVIGVTFEGTASTQDQHHSLRATLRDLYGAPRPGHDFVDTRLRGYGHAVPFVVLPLALLGLLAAMGSVVGAALGRGRAPPASKYVLGLALLLMLTELPSPAFWWARFNLHGVALLFVLAGFAVRSPGRRLWAEATIGACTAIAAMTLWWADPAWDVSFDEALQLAKLSPRERATRRIGWAVMMEPAGEAREREITEGDVVAWNGGFIAVAWNESLSNDVVWIPFTRDFLDRLDAAGAEWIITRIGTASDRALARSERYEKVGDVGPHVVAYRRTSL